MTVEPAQPMHDEQLGQVLSTAPNLLLSSHLLSGLSAQHMT